MKISHLLRPLSLSLTLTLLMMSAAHASKVKVIKAAGYVDVVEGKMVSPALIVVAGEKITAINPSKLPEQAEFIDLGDRTVLPGAIDVHSHITLDYFTGNHWTTAPVMETPADWALHGAKFGKDMLEAGFTTVRDAGSFPGFADVAVMRAINRGDIVGPSVYPAGHYISTHGWPL